MGEYIDVGVQSSIFPLTILLSSVALGIYALLGVYSSGFSFSNPNYPVETTDK